MGIKLEPIEVGGSTIWVEVEDIAAASAAPDGKTAKTRGTSAAPALDTLAKVDIASTLNAIIQPVHDALKAAGPQEVSVELSLGLKGEVGVFVAKSEANASLKVTAKWKFG